MSYHLDCSSLMSGFHEDVEFHFSLGITSLMRRFLAPRYLASYTSVRIWPLLVIFIGSKSLYCITLGVVEGFFGYIFPNLDVSGWNLQYKWGVTVRTHTKKSGKSLHGLHLRMPKRVLFFCNQYNADFRPLIFQQFWPLLKNKTWFGVRMRTPVKNYRNSAQGVLPVPKTAKNGYFQGGVCDKATAQTAQFQAMGIVWRTSRHPKDVPFVSEFWWGTYGLGAISSQKQQILAISPWRYCMVQHHSPGVDTLSSNLHRSVTPDRKPSNFIPIISAVLIDHIYWRSVICLLAAVVMFCRRCEMNVV